MTRNTEAETSFRELGLAAPVIDALDRVGYETPTPIQRKTIPLILEGRDVLGQAQTGTGKTAAFALPLLSSIDLPQASVQVLVLTPTRELAIQVAEAFQRYAAAMPDFHVLPIYGGQDYTGQLKRLKRGVHVVVGTPGRVIDHIKRSSLRLEHLRTLVLDEADEMLRMGFVDDVEWILEQTPAGRQVALFSATMPSAILRIARKHLENPAEITIESKSSTVDAITQRYLPVSPRHKIDALTRILEAEPFDGMIIFVRTKTQTSELAEKLRARGYAAVALNGDMPQNQREKTIGQLKTSKINIIIATDVAARGLDVERITHVINYDIPSDPESYVHRIGRTGRAGRNGDAILFVASREMSMLKTIEKVTRRSVDRMELPSVEEINDKRIAAFKQEISDVIDTEDLESHLELLAGYCREHDVEPLEVAAALAALLQNRQPLLAEPIPEAPPARAFREKSGPKERRNTGERRREFGPAPAGRDVYRIEVGSEHGVKPGNIAGAILNEVGLVPGDVGQISINDEYSTVELPEGMPKDVFTHLKRVWVCGRQLNISLMGGRRDDGGRSYSKPSKKRSAAPRPAIGKTKKRRKNR
ncbi:MULTISPECIES: DEAD/DEAH box helicase [Prosthecochloris]|uniref:ATP-dependent RNA helicase DeaD n=1 Tax=Prosthecochloris vibrioformis TaxID=1098 RepID=A0A5C4RZS5_PROVB|nr:MULTISPECIES: DEAD/DEAH box helicase [Prosthecochloris]ANT65351.1 Cold-shock DEAD box protein A [Prosthecochloris sp. CIB 2401]TNJ36227.1 DEAD/DEAH box helicase [Prosthecochloris vibrioformis]